MIRWALLSVVACSGCQILAPLPDEGSGGGGSAAPSAQNASGVGVSGATGASQASSQAAAGSGSGGEETCGDAACAAYCDAVTSQCSAFPQYPSASSCCAACTQLGASAMSCRALPGGPGDAASCTGAGIIGPGSGQQCQACLAVCSLFSHACNDTQPGAVLACASKCGGGEYAFDACSHLDSHDQIGCRLQNVLDALDSTGPEHDKACKDAADVKCEMHPCGP